MITYYNVIVLQGDDPTDAQVRLGLQSDNTPAAWAGGAILDNGVQFNADATGLTNYTWYDSVTIADGPLETLRGTVEFRSDPSSIASQYVEQYEDEDGPVVLGWNEDPRR